MIRILESEPTICVIFVPTRLWGFERPILCRPSNGSRSRCGGRPHCGNCQADELVVTADIRWRVVRWFCCLDSGRSSTRKIFRKTVRRDFATDLAILALIRVALLLIQRIQLCEWFGSVAHKGGFRGIQLLKQVCLLQGEAENNIKHHLLISTAIWVFIQKIYFLRMFSLFRSFMCVSF